MKRVAIFAASAAVIVQFTKQDVTTLQTLGCEIYILCPMQQLSISADAMDAYNQTYLNLIWHDVPFQDRISACRQNHRAAQELLRILQQIKPDLLHCHGTIAGHYGRKTARTMQLPCIYTAQDFRIYHGCPWRERLIFGTIERKYSKDTAAFLPVCEEDRAYAQKHLHAKLVQETPAFSLDDAYYTTPAHTAAEMRQALSIPEDAMVCLSVGELRMQKRLRIVLQAMARLHDKEALHYVICGDGPDRAFLMHLTERLHLTQRVHFLGYRTDVPDLLEMADIFCMPSRNEACGMAAMEAMAIGLLLIVVRNYGVKAYAEDGEGAFCLKGDDLVASCVTAIKQLCDNRLLRKQMGVHNRAAAKAFSDAEMMMRMRGLYQSCLKG